jgi:hypothetical protein
VNSWIIKMNLCEADISPVYSKPGIRKAPPGFENGNLPHLPYQLRSPLAFDLVSEWWNHSERRGSELVVYLQR